LFRAVIAGSPAMRIRIFELSSWRRFNENQQENSIRRIDDSAAVDGRFRRRV
jgi:hypothetical protein